MIHDLQILSTGPDLAEQQRQAMTSPCVAELLKIRLSHFDKGHDATADDATSYARMLENFDRDYFQLIRDRTKGSATRAEIVGAATAALKGAARLLAIADKCHRDVSRMAAGEQEAPEFPSSEGE